MHDIVATLGVISFSTLVVVVVVVSVLDRMIEEVSTEVLVIQPVSATVSGAESEVSADSTLRVLSTVEVDSGEE